MHQDQASACIQQKRASTEVNVLGLFFNHVTGVRLLAVAVGAVIIGAVVVRAIVIGAIFVHS